MSPLPWITVAPLPPSQDPPSDLAEPTIDPGWADRPLLDHIAAQPPGRLALDDGERRLTYGDLHDAACRVGAAIAGAGLPAGAIGVLMPNDARYLVAMLGCLAAGRPCMLLAAHEPAAYSLRVAAAAGLAGLISADDPPGEDIAHIGYDAALAARLAPPQPLDVAAPAIIVATSGSTGQPKALVRSQQAVLVNAIPRIRGLRFGPDDRAVVIGPASTAGALSHRFSPLLAGAALHLLDVHRSGLVGGLARIAATQATILHATPPLLTSLARLPRAPAAFAALRAVLMGGDALLHEDLRAIRACLPGGCRVQYGLGLSESSRIAHWCVPPDDAHHPLRVAAGYLVDGAAALLVDEDGNPVPPGEPGELVVRTPHGAIGDWVAGQVVADRFPRDPDDPDRRIIRTGDIVRIAPDGVLVVLGRKDRMVKIAGTRVEPAEIELAMRRVPGVAEAAVVALRGAGRASLAGFVVPADPAAGDELLAAVRAGLRAALPPALVPTRLLRIEAMPIAPSGKRDERALAALLEPTG